METGYYGIIDEVRVVLGDHETKNVTKMVDLLKSYDYKVTTICSFLEAMAMLSKGEFFFDVIIISVHSLNLNSFKLLAQAVTLDIISLSKKALKEGACIFLQRSLNEKIVKYLWKFALRRKIEREKARKGSEDGDKMIVNDVDTNNIDVDNEELSKETNDVPNPVEHRNNIHKVEDNIASNGKYKRRRKNNREDIKEDKVIKQKDGVKWTADLHAKFMKSLKQLGEGRCYPKDIVKVMDVPGLTRMQVASHLQHRPLLEMFGSQRLQDPIIGNINHSLGSTFNTWNRHTKSEYNLELNVAHKTTHSGSKIMPDISVENTTINDYNLNVNAGNINTYSGSTTMSDIDVGNATSDELGKINANFQQHIAEPNMSYPSTIIAKTYKSDIEGCDSNEKEDCDAYSNFHNMGYFFRNLGPPSANLPNSYDSEFDQVYSDD
ncbi:hypothetical protein H5410_052142 [Solanum commersonii]|uniref:Uncharacterized protein n=1 Tax=Solanum commersonii TaxID=4109 RepID=A0A9J5X0C2_SOLCO|nr:hypothetical protein H5410_052142 [Solanum commersonii]